MAEIRPFRGIVYRHNGTDISSRTAPPYDVISPAQREALLARDPANVVALELPEGPLDPALPGNRYETGARRWREWLESGVLAEDTTPAIYVLQQDFVYASESVRRRSLVVAVRLESFSAGVVLPHERTLPKAIDDRLNLIRATCANLSPVFGLFSDPAGETDPVFDAATDAEPMLSAEDDGVLTRVWAIRDENTIATLERMLADKKLFIADGHHRYTTALAHRDERRTGREDCLGALPLSAGRPDSPAHDFVLMALVNMDDPDLLVLPTHRVADAAGDFDPSAFWAALEASFEIAVPGPQPLEDLRQATRPAFLVRSRDGRTSLATLRDDIDLASAIPTNASDAWKSLDVAVLQELILWPLLGIHPDHPETLDRLTFVKDADEALSLAGERDVALVMNATRMDQLREVATGGEIMPQKSTYFYPKLPSGMLMRDSR